MSKQQNNTNGGSAKFALVVLILILVLVVGGAFAMYTFYGKDDFLEMLNNAGISTETLNKVTGMFNKESAPDKAVAEKKNNKPDSGKGSGVGGKSVKDILGGPEFSKGGVAPIQQVALRGGTPEPEVSAAPNPQEQKPEIEVVQPPAPPAPSPPPPPPPPQKKLPPFPKTNVPTLNFTVEVPELPPPPQKQPPTKSELIKSAKAAAQPEPAKTAQAVAPPPPPPPPPKPRATFILSNVSGRLSDRADVIVNMSVELTYESNNALREELEFKRDMLSTVAVSVLRRHEYGSVNTATLKTEILNVFNGHLHAGKLAAVEIKDFQIGQAVAGN